MFHAVRYDGMDRPVTNRNLMFLLVGAVIAVLAIVSYRVYEDNRDGFPTLNLGQRMRSRIERAKS